jgi:hypothetical protein
MRNERKQRNSAKMWQEKTLVYLIVISRHFLAGTKKNTKISSRLAGFGTDTSRIRKEELTTGL